MDIIFHEKSKQFHLFNDRISYIICILPGGEPGNLYAGKRIHDKEDLSYLIRLENRAMVVGAKDNELFSLELNRQEYPSFGTSDFRTPAFELVEENRKGGPVRLLGISCSDLIPEGEEVSQMSFFDEAGETAGREKQEKLEDAVAAIKNKLGKDSIKLGFRRAEGTGIPEGRG